MGRRSTSHILNLRPTQSSQQAPRLPNVRNYTPPTPLLARHRTPKRWSSPSHTTNLQQQMTTSTMPFLMTQRLVQIRLPTLTRHNRWLLPSIIWQTQPFKRIPPSKIWSPPMPHTHQSHCQHPALHRTNVHGRCPNLSCTDCSHPLDGRTCPPLSLVQHQS